MAIWEIAAEMAEEFSDVTWDKMLVNAMTVRMQKIPDTLVATDLHAILSELTGARAGRSGVALTAEIDTERRYPSMFDPERDAAGRPMRTFEVATAEGVSL